ncbi:hypothetical protein VTJ83DRAFT_3912 [Remersonia thermophila]|uniref:Tip elongation aberrant protein 1 n=1 Tax=Remersonia thermophila TaxID=72144 RepID=A0ABR4DFF4_9PEZI
MAFLFKSKKHQDRGLPSRDGSQGPAPIGSAAGRMRDEKGTRSTPTGSLHSIDNDGSPEQTYPRQRGQSLDQSSPPAQYSSEQPYRNGASAPMTNNPNASLYPWSQRRLTYTSSQPPPFPRYGAAVNAVSSKEGDIYVMGGLINSSTVKGDLWLIEAGANMACYPLATTAEGPGARVGHASLLVGNAFIVFGGDTKIEETDVLDETLYLLNTSTRQWSRALPAGPRPTGRYGHTLNILGSKLYVFGGQVEGYFMNDLCAFDLNQLQMPNNRWEILTPGSDGSTPPQGRLPAARTNHTMVTFNDKLYLFGGTNGFQWFNDVWSYDPVTNAWTQLDCIGYIPSPREGHAAALVDDVMYVFGGRKEDGSDLGDLAAFRITTRRWYTFQNMGPSPSPRSGHSMTSVGKTIVVLGGEPSSAATAVNDLALVYCLDTTKIRYPNDSGANSSRSRRPSDVTQSNSARNAPTRDGSRGPSDGRGQPPAQANGYRSPTNEPGAPNNQPGAARAPRPAGPTGPSGPPPQGQAPKPSLNNAPPRSRTASLERQEQPLNSPRGVTSPVPQQVAALKEAESLAANGRRTPPTQNPPRSASRQAESQPTDTPRSKPVKQGKSQEPVDSATEASLTQPQTSTRPSSPPPPTKQSSNPVTRRSSMRNSQTVALLKELDAARNRNAWYASELELARRAGYVPSASLSPVLSGQAMDAFDEDDKPLIEALLAMRAELANVQASIDKQAVIAAKQIAAAEKQRDAAIQEAVYAKAKLAARAAGSTSSTPQLDSDRDADDRSSEIGKKLAYALNAQKELRDQLDRLSAEYEAERKARKLADDTANAAQKRMTELETYKQQSASELEQLKAELHMAQREAREKLVAATEAASAAQMLRAEKEELEKKYAEALSSSDEHSATFESLQKAVAASIETKALLERKLDEERALRETVETKLNKLKAEHEARTAELVTTTQRLRDAEELAEQHANEARLHREAVLAGLEKISLRDASKSDKNESERVRALQAQVDAANALVRKYQQEADSAADRLRGAEERIAGLEAYQEQASREGVSIRRQLQNALRETQSLQAANSELKQQLERQQLEANALLVQHNALKDILSERGISPTSASSRPRSSPRSSPRGGSPEQLRLRELEQQLTAAQAALEETRSQAAQKAQESESAYREKLAQLENDYQSAVHYVKGTEKMLKQLKEQLTKYKTENTRLKEQVVELEDKVAEAGDAASKDQPQQAPSDWEARQKSLQAEVDRLQAELRETASSLEQQVKAVRQDLAETQQERDLARKTSEETNARLNTLRSDLEQLQAENALLERRAQDAEQKVSTLLDQVEMSVDNYRRRSRHQVPSMVSESLNLASPLPAGPNGAGAAGGNGQLIPGHMRQGSAASDSESLYGVGATARDSLTVGATARDSLTVGGGAFGGNARDSAALDSLANELETLRSQWEATNKNYRLSTTFDFDTNPAASPAILGKKDEGAAAGLSESLADWRKKMDERGADGGASGK